MKFNKIAAVLSSVLLTGLTLGTAAAASYPAPFVDNGVADVAIVYGTGAGVSSLDMTQAEAIQTSLGGEVDGGSTITVDGGESFMLDKSSNHFNFGDSLDTIYSSLDSEDLDFLADGTYDDGNIDEDYEQTITLGDQALELFADIDYNNDEPTVGFHFTNGDDVLDYTIDFDNAINITDMEDTDMPILGGTYYVLDADEANSKLTLLDSAEKNVIAEGESITVGDKTVSIEYIADGEVKFNVNGQSTDKLADHEYEELDDGSYIVANEVLYAAKEAGTSKVEFSIGAGKMVLQDGYEVEINDEDVDNLDVIFTGALDSITLSWDSDNENFLTEDNVFVMPAFEAIQLAYGGTSYDGDAETISVDSGDTLTLSMGNYDVPVMWHDSLGPTTALGEENYLLVTANANIAGTYNNTITVNNTGSELELSEDNRFIVTSMDTDLTDIEVAYYEVSSIDYNDDGDFTVELTDLIGTNDLTFDDFEDHDRGDINIELLGVNATAYFNFTTVGTLGFNKAVSDKGLLVTLPTSVTITNSTDTSTLTFTEANTDEDIGAGTSFTSTIKLTSNDKLHVSSTSVSTEEEASDKYVGYVASDLTSMVNQDQTGDEYEFSIDYYGKEALADVQVVTGGTVSSTAADALGDVLVKDTEVASMSSKNLVIVGGSCINSAAATVLGGAYCGAAFTDATGVGAGEFLIKGVQDAYTTGKLALVVAGYEAADTVNAATYLTNKDVDTSKNYKGTSASSATLVVA